MKLSAITAAPLCAGVLLAACSASPSHTPSPQGSPTPGITSSASPVPSGTFNTTTMSTVTAADLPATSPGPFTQVSDGLLAGHASTDQRTFTNADGSVIVEVDVILEASQGAISGDYSQVHTAAHNRVTSVAASTKPAIGEQADESSGTTGDGKGIVAITFARLLTVNAVLVETPTSPDTQLAEQIATALDVRIQGQG